MFNTINGRKISSYAFGVKREKVGFIYNSELNEPGDHLGFKSLSIYALDRTAKKPFEKAKNILTDLAYASYEVEAKIMPHKETDAYFKSAKELLCNAVVENAERVIVIPAIQTYTQNQFQDMWEESEHYYMQNGKLCRGPINEEGLIEESMVDYHTDEDFEWLAGTWITPGGEINLGVMEGEKKSYILSLHGTNNAYARDLKAAAVQFSFNENNRHVLEKAWTDSRQQQEITGIELQEVAKNLLRQVKQNQLDGDKDIFEYGIRFSHRNEDAKKEAQDCTHLSSFVAGFGLAITPRKRQSWQPVF